MAEAEENAPRARPPHILRESPERKKMEEELKKLREEEERPTLETVEGLKKSLCQVNRENVRKEAVIRRLTARLSKRARKIKGDVGAVVEKTGKQIVVGTDVETDAIAIFPEEIWELILDKVVDPRDRLNCYNACALFRKLLHQWKLVKCRLVSKGWKEAVDDSLRNHPSLRPHDEKTYNPRLHPFFNPQRERGISDHNKFCFEIQNPYGETRDLEDPEYIQRTRQKLVMWRSARLQIFGCLDEYDQGERNQFWNEIYTCLKTFGEAVSGI